MFEKKRLLLNSDICDARQISRRNVEDGLATVVALLIETISGACISDENCRREFGI